MNFEIGKLIKKTMCTLIYGISLIINLVYSKSDVGT